MEVLLEKLLNALLTHSGAGLVTVLIAVLIIIWWEVRSWRKELLEVKTLLLKLVRLHTLKYPRETQYLYEDDATPPIPKEILMHNSLDQSRKDRE